LDDNQVILTSRGYKEWTEVSHINEELGKILGPGDILDGEIYVHGTFTFQKLCSLVKRKQSETLQLEYHVYDMPSCKGEDSLPWRERKNNLMELFTKNPGLKYIKLVPTITVNNEADVVNAHLQSVSDGYEGGMIRLLDGVYDFGHRSNDLLKVKSFDDAEFKVVGATNGVGKFVNACIWICENKNGQQFRVTPKCPQEEKEKYLRESDKYIGKMLTVGYFGLTDDGIPRFPIGKAFRLNEDLTA
jgi:DNA ligase-1